MNWNGKHVLVTGGASFIGSHLVDALVERGAAVRVVDDLSSGKLEYIEAPWRADLVEFFDADLREQEIVRGALEDIQVVFHLAADHGGRGYVDLHQAACAGNLLLDGLLFRECLENRVEKVVYASSGCVYPNHLQADPDQVLYLSEDMVGPPYDADNMYGWAKLMAEMTLRHYHEDRGLRSACCRYFTVYGPRGHENHAVMAMVARAFVKQDPFVVWGDGSQIRNWTYVSDIVRGTMLAAEKIDDGRAVNLGTMERIRVIEAAEQAIAYAGYRPEIEFRTDMPTGPLNRVADNTLAQKLLGWAPEVSFAEGLKLTADWYFASQDREHVEQVLENKLTER